MAESDTDPVEELEQDDGRPRSRLEDTIESIRAKFGDEQLPFRFGRKYLKRHERRRRVVWVPAGGRTVSPSQAGGREAAAQGGRFRVQINRMRLERVVAHIYGETFHSAEEILDALIAAIDLTVPHVEFGDHRWPTEDETGKAGETLRTQKCVLPITFRYPVIEEVRKLTPLAAVAVAGGLLQEDGSVESEE